MATITEVLTRFKSLDVIEQVVKSANETSLEFEDSQRDQLMAGKTKTGAKISPRYSSKDYATKKAAMNPLAVLGTPDLRLTGAFQDRLDMQASSKVFDIISKDEKSLMLEDKYPDILGLGTTYKSKYIRTLEPVLISNIKTFLKL